jgi:hypothetical protein
MSYFASTVHISRDGRSIRLHLHRVTAAIATGKRPVPFRTRKLSPSAPMVLRGRLRGRVGRRRTSFANGHPSGWPLCVVPTSAINSSRRVRKDAWPKNATVRDARHPQIGGARRPASPRAGTSAPARARREGRARPESGLASLALVPAQKSAAGTPKACRRVAAAPAHLIGPRRAARRPAPRRPAVAALPIGGPTAGRQRLGRPALSLAARPRVQDAADPAAAHPAADRRRAGPWARTAPAAQAARAPIGAHLARARAHRSADAPSAGRTHQGAPDAPTAAVGVIVTALTVSDRCWAPGQQAAARTTAEPPAAAQSRAAPTPRAESRGVGTSVQPAGSTALVTGVRARAARAARQSVTLRSRPP